MMRDVLALCAGGAERFVVVDCETTGVYPSDRIVELAIVTLGLDGQILDVYDTLVNPQRDVSATHIHGITGAMVADAPTFGEIAGDVATRLHGGCFIAHNVPFDARMLASEFARLGEELFIERGIDTYVESGCRLADACAQNNIDLSGAHRALVDAQATASLFLRLAGTCDRGVPLSAPFGFARVGKVRRREDVGRVALVEPELITYLATRLPHTGLETRSQLYLEMVGRAVADLHFDADERREVRALAEYLQMTDGQIAQAHRRYVNDLIDAALADDEVTDDEYDALVRVAAALDVNQQQVDTRVHHMRVEESLTVLTEGMIVVFTGGHEVYERDELHAYATRLGLTPDSGVTKRTGFVCAADPTTTSGKAGKARRWGIPIISMEEFLHAHIGEILAGSGAGQAALKVITCPDCHVTWTVSAVSTANTRRRCDPCARLAGASASKAPRSKPAPALARDMWAAPIVEWLSCRGCNTTWARQISKGRKPHYCPACSGATMLSAPQL